MLKDKGLHYTDEGLKLIHLIVSQMNNRGLSNSGLPVKDRVSISTEIQRFLNGPSNYELREGRIWIVSQNKYLNEGVRKEVQLIDSQGNILKVFNSLTDCGNYLGIAKSTVSDRINKNKSFKFNNSLVSLRLVEVSSILFRVTEAK